ncbi:MAG TPA: AI-2E family transporter [Anaeromyxobacter sp.]|nr:AI-2E family transporter [Anaeromyxobacter sp.]
MASELHAHRLLVALVLLSVALVVALASPFWAPLTLAAVFAAALHGWMDALARLLRGRRRLSALILTLGVLLAVLLPLGGLGAGLASRIVDGVEWTRGALESQGIAGLIARLPAPLHELALRLVAAIPDPQQQIQALAGARGSQAAEALGGILLATGSAMFRAALFLIALFFLLTDGMPMVHWLDAHVPLRPGQLRTLLGEFRRTSVSVLLASVVTALLQTAAALVGYLVARAPNTLFLALATFVVALVPALGGTLVVVLTGLLLLATGHPVAGVFLLAWAVLVSAVDSVARPYLLRGGMAVHGGLMFFALLGGLAVFGGMGLVIGPLALTFLVTALRMYRREFGPPAPQAAEPPARAHPPAA